MSTAFRSCRAATIRRRVLLSIAAVVAALAVVPATAGAGGSVVLAGIDAEDGGPGGHGPIENYATLVNAMLAKGTTGSGILVIGGGHEPGDDPTAFWQEIDARVPGHSVTFVNGAAAIAGTDLRPFRLIAVVSDEANTFGGLTAAEDAALDARQADVADFVNGGGGLLGFASDGANPYGYVSALVGFTAHTGLSYSEIIPTDEGRAIGIDENLSLCCWHDTFTGYPTFLAPLAVDPGSNEAAAIGGGDVVVVNPGQPARVSLTPASAVLDGGTQACLTATVEDPTGALLSGVDVVFGLGGASRGGQAVATDGSGRAVFCYVGPPEGEDQISAFADADRNGTRGASEPASQAARTWRRVVRPPLRPDRDRDGVLDASDNCLDRANADQRDRDQDGIGDACDGSDGSLPPVLGRTVSARVVTGEVLVKKGRSRTFVPLKGAETIPVGSTLDTTRGTVDIVAATSARGRTQSGRFAAGIFQIKQLRARRGQPVSTDLVMQGTAFASSCRKGPRAKGVVRQLVAEAKGRWRTLGRSSVTAPVKGRAAWVTQDRCNGTVTKVTRGRAAVKDLGRARTVMVSAGRSYLARVTRAQLRRSRA